MTRHQTTTASLRPAAAADQRHITRLIWRVGINPMGIKWPRFVVAEIDGRFVGCAQLKPHRDGSLELASVAVHPNHQAQGIGSQLVRHLIGHTHRELHLMCERSRQSYYRRFGFETVAGAAALPKYFRRIYKVVRLISPLAGGPPLAIMHRPAELAAPQ